MERWVPLVAHTARGNRRCRGGEEAQPRHRRELRPSIAYSLAVPLPVRLVRELLSYGCDYELIEVPLEPR